MTRLPQFKKPLGKLRRFGLLGGLLALFTALFAGEQMISGGDPSLEFHASAAPATTSSVVDQSPLRTARELASQAAVAQEQQYAEQVLRLADSEVDQDFAGALRSATSHAPPLTGEALHTSQRLNALNDRIRAEQAALAMLKVKAAPDDSQLQLAQAQLALDTDEADELHQTLIRLGGDRHALIQQALDEHEAMHKEETSAAASETAALETPEALRSLLGKVRALRSLRSRHQQLLAAQAAAQNTARQLLDQRDKLSRATETASSNAAATDSSLTHLHALADSRQQITQDERRIRDFAGLSDTYGKWDTLVVAQQRTVLRRILRATLFIIGIVVVTILAGRLLRRLLTSRALLDRRRQQTLHFVLSFALQLVGAVLILVIFFGTPQQTPTVIGLATAGLTVVLKDFIVAFFGWFILMGRNGVRVGDWVEINGVGGEVVEVGLLRTTLLETGNWAESGRPTGRRVAFMNSYAIEGHYFNFSTAGQWLWEELSITLPSSEDAYALTNAIRSAVDEITRDDRDLATREWRRLRLMQGSSLTSISADPMVELRPSLQVAIRYVTRAQDRFAMRSRLNQRLLTILHAAPQFAPESIASLQTEDETEEETEGAAAR
jgi:small-conductance mechanosensitive channel